MNESLIERGRILMDISFLRSSNREIKNMNKGMVGAPFEYSRTYIQFLAFLKIGFKFLASPKKFKAQKVEAGLKVMLYNKFIDL
jgi:hypothetical protein